MNDRLKQMLQRYTCNSQDDYTHALKEIMQEIALLGLWRSKFFEKAAFYGGTALRILYGLDRFSEDLDFSLLVPQENFSLTAYNTAIKGELESFGLSVSVENKVKSIQNNIQSAFIKAETKQQLIQIEMPSSLSRSIDKKALIKIKMEIDVNPPGGFLTEAKILLQPIPFNVLTMQQPDLFAGKIHAILCRNWKGRVKGRDWYDMVWFISQNIPVRLEHLRQRLIQNHTWDTKKSLEQLDLIKLVEDKIDQIDFSQAKEDVLPFLRETASVALWSQDFFKDIIQRIKIA
jgi:predicted nucleotidyltransferase component of viral defense system